MTRFKKAEAARTKMMVAIDRLRGTQIQWNDDDAFSQLLPLITAAEAYGRQQERHPDYDPTYRGPGAW